MSNSLLLTDGLIFDGHSPDLIADKYILIKDDRIASISSELKRGLPVKLVVDNGAA